MTSTELILMFVKSLALADHLGDVADDVDSLLTMLNVDAGQWNNLDELGENLGRMGVKYMHEIENYRTARIDDELPAHANCSVCRVFHENGHGGLRT